MVPVAIAILLTVLWAHPDSAVCASQATVAVASWRPCPPDMVPVDGFCIDRYEYPNREGEYPIVYVSYVHAEQLCLAQGKRLCTTQEWIRACCGPQRLAYPYGREYVEGKCNLAGVSQRHYWTWYGLRKTERKLHVGKMARSGSFKSCVSWCGAYDMLGNVWEWTDAGRKETAILMGGAWVTPADTVTCLSTKAEAWKVYPTRSVGFRCCRDFLPKPQSKRDVQKSSE